VETKVISTERVEIRYERDVVTARKLGREIAGDLGFDTVDSAKVATAISELARNIVLYGVAGEIEISAVVEDGERVGVRVVARDTGPGIANPELALRDGYTTSDGLGLGLPGTRRLMDQFELVTTPGQGTTVTVVKYPDR